MARVLLNDIAYARSGDKGDICNIAVIAKEKRFYPVLLEQLTAAAVKGFFGPMAKGEVTRYEVPTLEAMNFVLRNALGGGATRSLRADFTGKTMCQAVLRIELDVDDALLGAPA